MTISLYPEIQKAGSLKRAINDALEEAGSPLRASGYEGITKLPFAYARVQNENRFSQIYIAAEEKLYLFDFWRDGVCLAHARIEDLNLLAQCLQCWLVAKPNTSQLAVAFNFVTPNKGATFFDEGKEVAYNWDVILHDHGRKEIRPFVALAIKDEVLSKLFPYTSLMTLCFSRCTGYPYTTDTPTVTPNIKSKQFIVRNGKGVEIGSGSAREALQIVKTHLPKDIAPAVKGTAETYKNHT